jgi:hypothetical protein
VATRWMVGHHHQCPEFMVDPYHAPGNLARWGATINSRHVDGRLVLPLLNAGSNLFYCGSRLPVKIVFIGNTTGSSAT